MLVKPHILIWKRRRGLNHPATVKDKPTEGATETAVVHRMLHRIY